MAKMLVTRSQIINAGANVSTEWFCNRVTPKGERIIDKALCNVYETVDVRNELVSYMCRVGHLKPYNKRLTEEKCKSVLEAINNLEVQNEI